MKRYLRRLGLVVIAATLLLGLMPLERLAALSTVGPDPAEYGGANVMYTLSDTSSVQGATTMGVPVYYRSWPGNVWVNVSYGPG